MTRARDFADVISGQFDLPVGSLDNAVVGTGEITTAKLADAAVTTAKLTDANVTTAKIANDSVTSAKVADSVYQANKNMIINGNMQINQRGDSTGITSSGYYSCDRFRFTIGNAGTWSISQSTTAPTGFSSSYKVDCTTADASPASSDFLFIEQRIEGYNLQRLAYGASGAKKLTLSFYVRSNKTGTYAIEFQHGDAGSNYWNNNTYTISAANTWEQKTITISGQTATAINNDNGIGLYVRWWLVSGTQYSSGTVTNDSWHQTDANRAAGQVNLADSTSNEFYLTGVQIEEGDQATPYEHRLYQEELAKCQRYFTKWTNSSVYYGARYSTGNGFVFLDCPARMRVFPTVTTSTSQTSTGLDLVSYNSQERVAVYMASTIPYIGVTTASAEL